MDLRDNCGILDENDAFTNTFNSSMMHNSITRKRKVVNRKPVLMYVDVCMHIQSFPINFNLTLLE